MTSRTTRQTRRRDRRWGIFLILLPFVGVLCLALMLLLQDRTRFKDPEFIPVNLHSQLEANYLANPNQTRVPG